MMKRIQIYMMDYHSPGGDKSETGTRIDDISRVSNKLITNLGKINAFFG